MITNLHELNIKEPRRGAKIRILSGAINDGIPRSEVGQERILRGPEYHDRTWTYYANIPPREDRYWYIEASNFELI